MDDELIILTDNDFEPEEGEKGWGEPLRGDGEVAGSEVGSC